MNRHRWAWAVNLWVCVLFILLIYPISVFLFPWVPRCHSYVSSDNLGVESREHLLIKIFCKLPHRVSWQWLMAWCLSEDLVLESQDTLPSHPRGIEAYPSWLGMLEMHLAYAAHRYLYLCYWFTGTRIGPGIQKRYWSWCIVLIYSLFNDFVRFGLGFPCTGIQTYLSDSFSISSVTLNVYK